MSGVHEDEDSPEEIFVKDVVLDVVGVVLDAEGEQFQDEAEQLHRARVHAELLRLRPAAVLTASALWLLLLLVVAGSGSVAAVRALDSRVAGGDGGRRVGVRYEGR